VAMTADQRKIKRLEKQVADFKKTVEDLKMKIRQQDYEIVSERQWRQDFQRLMKDVVHADKLDDLDREYW
jgi:predicted  nucleic acid-binding Zn-ribbon protein